MPFRVGASIPLACAGTTNHFQHLTQTAQKKKAPVGSFFQILAERVGFVYILQTARARACARLRIPRASQAAGSLLSAKEKSSRRELFSDTGGEGGIRTHGTVTRTPDFESGTFDHSATSPGIRWSCVHEKRDYSKVFWNCEELGCSRGMGFPPARERRIHFIKPLGSSARRRPCTSAALPESRRCRPPAGSSQARPPAYGPRPVPSR